ncbi:ATP-binding cassette domain-containing protein [Bacillus aquiflavi]|uniref:ATP-binding cassette domain-containing protein n=1 Tax=Bacillus aquiflavi TaxID=2672567 RepID=UPI001CA8962F|nr:ATP-binding cassette domain-containing protein [Bacillus aquiflavi]UAC48024.1 ATP-binding cassette domain-containing protein [Bacillus aquiflavi]
MSFIIQTYNLTKIFNGKEVISNVNLKVEKGKIYGFLGPNGAGKTTVMKLITGLLKPTAGEIEMFGEKLTNTSYEIFKRLGLIIEYPIFYEKLTGRENLELHCKYMGFHNENAIDEVLKLVNLQGIEGKEVKDFLLGMKQRLGLARAIITKPELLILDEPINGLDPVGIKEFREIFKMLSKEYGVTILISSHILSELEKNADTIGVISEGKLITEVSMENIKGEHVEFIEVQVKDVKKASYVLDRILNISNFKVLDQHLIRIYESGFTTNELSKAFVLNDVDIESVTKKQSTLEDYFLKLINGEKRYV